MATTTTSGQRSWSRQRGTTAYRTPASAASGPKMTAAWVTRACSGSPLISITGTRSTMAKRSMNMVAACRPPTTPTTCASRTSSPTTPTRSPPRRFKALDLHVMSKPDLTPVTDADQAVEEGIRRTLSRVRSRDAVTGEEQGSTGHSQRRWVVDPIDGTKNFVRGVPVWATLIALVVDDEVVLGVVSAPAAAAPLVGVRGQRRVDRPVAAEGHAVPGLRHPPARGRLAVLRLAARVGGARPDRGLPLADAALLAHSRVRRLLVLHAAGRGRRRPGRRAAARGLRHGRPGRDRPRGRREVRLARRHRRPVRAATRWPPTATCTTPRCRSSGRCPTATTPDWPATGGSVSDLRAHRDAPAVRRRVRRRGRGLTLVERPTA